jgi:plastocyanin
LAIEAGVDREREAVLTRGILPFALPIASVLVLGVFVINLSRAFLAGGSDGALIIGVVAILTIMGIAAFLSAAPRIRSSSMVMVVSSVLILVVSAGLISLGPSEEKKEGAGAAYQPPKGPAVATVEVDALPALKFQAKNFDTQAGINAIKYVDKGGTHTLVFDEPQFTGFELKVPQGPTTGKVLLKPGKYTIYCTIPGHRAAGMEATITVQ